MATHFRNCSLLGFVPLKALGIEGLSAQRVWHGAGHESESSVRAQVGPKLFIMKLMMTYAAFTRYFTRPFAQLSASSYFTIGGCSSQRYFSVRCMQHSSKGECLPSNSVCKACSQKVEKLLKFESSVSSILITLKASVQALALTATTQALSAQRAKRASVHILTYLQTI